jgi:hypothetical protein
LIGALWHALGLHTHLVEDGQTSWQESARTQA